MMIFLERRRGKKRLLEMYVVQLTTVFAFSFDFSFSCLLVMKIECSGFANQC